MIKVKRNMFSKPVAICFSLFIAILSQSARADCVGVFFALDKDLESLAAAFKAVPQTVAIGDRRIYVFQIPGHTVAAVKMGSGVVETAISSQILLGKYRCNIAFSLGPVGSLDESTKVGSWVTVAQCVAYQKGSWQPVGFSLSPKAKIESFPKGLKRVEGCMPATLTKAEKVLVASGEAFIASESYREQLRELTLAQAVDMNFFGLMTACQSNNVPLVSWRIVSDKADDNAGEDFRKFLDEYDGAGGKMLAEVIAKLPPDPESPDSYPAIQKALEGK